MHSIICDLCKGNQPENYVENDDRILKCPSCGTVFLSHKLRIADINAYYSQGDFWRDQLADPEGVEALERDARARLKLIRRYIANPQRTKILDIGTHDGLFVKEALRLGFDAAGLEPNKHIASRAQEAGLPVYDDSLDNWRTNDKFDIVSAFHVLEHLERPREAIIKMKELLKENGLLALEVPNIESFLAKRHGLSWRFIALEHLFYFSPATLRSLLEEVGFKVLLSKKRNFEIRYLSLNNILQYFRPTALKIDRFKMKTAGASQVAPTEPPLSHRLLRKLGIKDFLAFVAGFLGREDHIFILARRSR